MYTCMYVCMYVCKHVSTYVCKLVCMYVCTVVFLHGRCAHRLRGGRLRVVTEVIHQRGEAVEVAAASVCI